KLTGPPGTAFSVAGVGDLNNDGRDDFAVLRAGTGSNGNVSVVFGRALTDPFPANAAIGAVAGATLTTSDFDLTGFVVHGAGDVDHDGRQDVLVSGASTSYLIPGSAVVGSVGLTTVGLRIPAGGVVGLGNVNGDVYADLGASTFESSSSLSNPSDRMHQVAWVFLGGPAAGLNFDLPALVLEP